MPRPRSIPFQKRVEIFLDYRRLGRKVYPVAIRHDVARSTVTLIVIEFREDGFSDRPRLSVSRKLLEHAEKRHQCEVIKELQKGPNISVPEPAGNVRAGLGEGSALDKDAEDMVRRKSTLGLSAALVWHLKSSEAEKTLEDVEKAIIEYNVRCLELWQRIRGDLEKGAGAPVMQAQTNQGTKNKRQLYPVLVDEVYRYVCSQSMGSERFRPDWPRLQLREGATAGELELDNTAVARAARDQEKLASSVLETVQGYGPQYLEAAKRLAATHGDLRYVLSYAQDLLKEVQPDHVERGICPDCPYPESRRRNQDPTE